MDAEKYGALKNQQLNQIRRANVGILQRVRRVVLENVAQPIQMKQITVAEPPVAVLLIVNLHNKEVSKLQESTEN